MSHRYIRSTSPFYIVMLGLLSALPPLAIDIGLPAIPALQSAFHISIGEATRTLTMFLLGFSVGPILFGPLSDRYGRKPVLLAGLALFSLAAFACAFAGQIGELLLVRLLQGVAAGAAAALPAAIIRDVFSGHAALTRQSYVALVNAVAPLVAPLIGATLLQFGSWRLIYQTLGAIGVLLLLLAAWGYEESRPATNAAPRRHVFADALHAYGQVLRNRHYLIHAALVAASFGTMFAYITGSSAVFIDMLGVSSTTYGMLFALTAAGTIAGAAAGGRLAHVWGADRLLLVGVLGSGAISLVLLLAAAAGAGSVPVVAACVVLSNVCAGLVMPNATHQALATVGNVAGSAAALLRSLQMLAGAAAGALVGLLAGNQLTVMATVMALAAVGGVALLLVRQALLRAAPSPADGR
ncbi:DHA1 family bicyclomycin/chloramphenicol resistance-like MFS transporter [Duganella sp. 1224]|uniref:multidrug effflux MFS transporter n=1 Tax=Duganella sp. 1224 TaxID=2587052 RepID=UPI0015CC7ED3|nr:multidrug effflux MFS transporter [Duganella sp. 1224]NYE60719.1 DHA1 family bicyclomycin/chloramphenicol resistance-like MFS transporter [Duganella sp. 1224]